VRASKARARAERWVGTVRRECFDRLLILGRRDPELVIKTYALHYEQQRHTGPSNSDRRAASRRSATSKQSRSSPILIVSAGVICSAA
jgi:hypothetical protein